MKNYQDLLKEILANGTWQSNRTGIDAISIPGSMLKFDLAEGFPAVTTKKLFFGAVKGELIGFLRGYTSAADFRAVGCKIWDQNANENAAWLANPNRRGEDDLGRIYGAQWRDWRTDPKIIGAEPVSHDGVKIQMMAELQHGYIDQVQRAVDTIKNDPTNRRIIINAWRPDEFDQMALPPCHILSQFLVNVEKQELSLCYYQRSCDTFLGVPFNIASYALLLSMMAEVTGYTPRFLTAFMADTHIYRNHLTQVDELLSRTPMAPPTLDLAYHSKLEDYEPDDINLVDYMSHPEIKAPMAV
jgi:thymidylate synthase